MSWSARPDLNHWPLRPELEAVLGGWPLPQLTEGVGDSQCLLLSGVVAVLGCCIVTARTLQGMARVRSGQAPAWPLVSDRSVRRGSRVKRDFACAFTSHLTSRTHLPGCASGRAWVTGIRTSCATRVPR